MSRPTDSRGPYISFLFIINTNVICNVIAITIVVVIIIIVRSTSLTVSTAVVIVVIVVGDDVLQGNTASESKIHSMLCEHALQRCCR